MGLSPQALGSPFQPNTASQGSGWGWGAQRDVSPGQAAVTRVGTEGGGGQVLLAVSLVVGSLSSMQSRGTGCHWLQGHKVIPCPFLSPDHQKLEREARICRLLKHSNIGE